MRRRDTLLFIAGCPVFALQRGTNVGRRIPPVDHAAKDPKLASFRGALLSAIARRDAAWVTANLAPEPVASFGEDRTPASFARYWELEKGAPSRFWREIAAVLRYGGAFQSDGKFASPYYYALFPHDIDGNEYEVVVKPGAILRASPESQAAVVETLRWDVVEIQSFDDEPFRYVRSASGKLGYVERAALRSPLGARAILARIDGAWRLESFLSGD